MMYTLSLIIQGTMLSVGGSPVQLLEDLPLVVAFLGSLTSTVSVPQPILHVGAQSKIRSWL